MTTERQAVDAFADLGLTEYEAKCFVALSRMSRGTAKEISQVSEVPRPRVYDVVKGLHDRGLVDVQQSEPREYQAVPVETAIETLRQQYGETLDDAKTAIDGLTEAPQLEQKGVWAIANHDHVAERMQSLIDDADEELYLHVVDEESVDDALLERIAAAADRDVTIVTEVPSESVAETIREIAPDAATAVSEAMNTADALDGHQPGRTVMVDREAVLLSATGESDLPGVRTETGVWCQGVDHGLLVWLRTLLSSRVELMELRE